MNDLKTFTYHYFRQIGRLLAFAMLAVLIVANILAAVGVVMIYEHNAKIEQGYTEYKGVLIDGTLAEQYQRND